jgi:hypothetical protein
LNPYSCRGKCGFETLGKIINNFNLAKGRKHLMEIEGDEGIHADAEVVVHKDGGLG